MLTGTDKKEILTALLVGFAKEIAEVFSTKNISEDEIEYGNSYGFSKKRRPLSKKEDMSRQARLSKSSNDMRKLLN